MQTYPLKDRVQSQVSFSKSVNAAITAKANELGITRSRLVNAIVQDRLLQVTPVVAARKTVLRKAKK